MAEKAEKMIDDRYRIHIVGRHMTQTEAIKQHILGKLDKVEHISHQLIDVYVRLETQKTENRCSITLKFSHFKIQAHAATTDLYASIDKAIERLVSKLRKWKDKIQHHHQRGVAIQEVPVDIHEPTDLEEINEMIEEENERRNQKIFEMPKIAKSRSLHIKTLTLAEAMMKMELSDDNFLIYRSEEEQKLKVIYRRRDGSYGVITPE